jgi:hypothetical protein
MVTVTAMAMFVDTAHLLGSTLFLKPSWILHASVVKAADLGRIPAIWLEARWSGRAAMADVIHAGPRLLCGGFFCIPVVFPLTHPLGPNRRRTPVMLPM